MAEETDPAVKAKINELESKRIENLQKEHTALEAKLNITQQQLALDESNVDMQKQQITQAMKLLEVRIQMLETGAQEVADAETRAKYIANLTGQLKDLKNEYDAIGPSAQDFAGDLLKIAGVSDKAGDSLSIKLAKGLHAARNNTDEFAESMREAVTSGAVFNSIIAKLDQKLTAFFVIAKKMAFGLDEAQASMSKAMQGGRQYDEVIKNSYKSMNEFGVTQQEAVESTLALQNQMTEFSSMSEEAQENLVKQTALLSELGIASDVQAKNAQFANKIMGVSAENSGELQSSLVTLADSIGVSAVQLSSAFAAAGPQLAKFGDQADEAFEGLAAAAKATGIEVSRLLDITAKFDTFDGAAESVGNLNAILGGDYLNSLELLQTTDPTERLQMMRGALDDAGMSFDNMDYYQRIAIANAMGLQGPAELAQLMSGNLEDLAGGAEMTAEQMIEQQERAAAAQATMKQFELAIAEVAETLMPLIEMFLSFVRAISPLIKFLAPVIVPALILLKLGMMAVRIQMVMATLATAKNTAALVTNSVVASGNAASKGANAAATGADTAADLANTGSKVANTAATGGNTAADLTNTGSKVANTASTVGNTTAEVVNTGSKVANTGVTGGNTVAEVSNTAAKTGGRLATLAGTIATGASTAARTAATAITGLFTGALTALVPAQVAAGTTSATAGAAIGAGGAAAAPAVPIILSLAVAFLAMGAAVYIAAAGLALVVRSFSDMDAGEILAISVAIVAFGFAMNMLLNTMATVGANPAVWLGIAAIFAIAAAIALVTLGMSVLAESMAIMFVAIDVAKVQAFALMVATLVMLGVTFAFVATAMVIVAAGMFGFAVALALMDEDKLASLATIFDSFANTSAEQLFGVAEAVTAISEAISDMPTIKTILFNVSMDNLAKAATAIRAAHIGSTTEAARKGRTTNVNVKTHHAFDDYRLKGLIKETSVSTRAEEATE